MDPKELQKKLGEIKVKTEEIKNTTKKAGYIEHAQQISEIEIEIARLEQKRLDIAVEKIVQCAEIEKIQAELRVAAKIIKAHMEA